MAEQIVDMLLAVQRPASVVTVQRRDNWSRETVRSLGRKIRNLKAQISVRDASITRWFDAYQASEKKFRSVQRMRIEERQQIRALEARARAAEAQVAELRTWASKALQAFEDARSGHMRGDWAVTDIESAAKQILAADPDERGAAIMEAGKQLRESTSVSSGASAACTSWPPASPCRSGSP